jgi:phosphate transport system substrate-binding protein
MKGNKAAGRTRTCSIKAIIAVAVITVLSICLSGCGGSSKGAFEGTVKVSGSTTLLPVAEEAAFDLMDLKKGVNIQVQGGGSSVGITQLKEKIVQVGMSSRDLQPGEDPGNFVDNKVAYDIIAIIVNPSVRIKSLSVQQVKDIFTGKVTDWSQVGAKKGAITVVVRDLASGTRDVFDQKALGSTKDKPVASVGSAIQCSSNGLVRDTVASTKNCIGYISFGYVNKTIKPLLYDGVEPTVPNAVAGKYPMARFLHMFTRGAPSGTIKEYIDFMLSEKFQKDVVAQMYVPVDEVQKVK